MSLLSAYLFLGYLQIKGREAQMWAPRMASSRDSRTQFSADYIACVVPTYHFSPTIRQSSL